MANDMTITQSCPNESVLRRLASGSLTEQHAEDLFTHLDECPTCQNAFDQMGLSMAGILGAARHPLCDKSSESPTVQLSKANDNERLAGLIEQAQKLAPSDSKQEPKQARSEIQPVSFDEFVHGLRSSGLFPANEIEQCLGKFESESGSNSSEMLAQTLVNHRILTVFQAKLLLKGRWKGLVLDDYAILERLGQGGMGSVFRAKHLTLDRVVCLKVISSAGRQSPLALDRFRVETRALATLNHPNIVVAHDAGESKGVPYLVMQYIEGNDLAKHVKENGPMSVETAIEIVVQVAQAMQYAHQKGVVHRDVKPHNLFLSQDDDSGRYHIHVLDLGLAKFDSLLTNNPDASVMAAMTNTGIVVGTVDYMSPEQALDSRTADARSDIYSLGCTLYFLITGRPPFEGETVMQRLIAHRESVMPPLDMHVDVLPDGLNACLERMLAKNPEERPASMQQVIKELQQVREGTYLSPIKKPHPSAAIPIVTPPPVSFVGESDQEGDDIPGPHAITVTPPAPSLVHHRSWRSIGFPLITALAMSVLGLGLATSDVFTRQGRDRAIKHGGIGRAMVVVSSKRFEDSEYLALVREMKDRDIDVVTTSPNFGTESKDYGSEMKDATSNIPFDAFKTDEFDAIFFIGGDNLDLIHKSPKNHKKIQKMVNDSSSDGVLISSVGKGWNVITDANGCACYESNDEGQIRVSRIKGHPGQYIHAHKLQGVPGLIDKVFTTARETATK